MIRDIVEHEGGLPTDVKLPRPPSKRSIFATRSSKGSLSSATHTKFSMEGQPHDEAFSTSTAESGGVPRALSTDIEEIHRENLDKLARMKPEEIEHETEELYKVLDPAVLRALLRRAQLKNLELEGWSTVKDIRVEASTNRLQPYKKGPEAEEQRDASQERTVEGTGDDTAGQLKQAALDSQSQQAQAGGAHVNAGQSQATAQPRPHMHFPPTPEELRPYFQNLPLEPEKLSWMQPVTAEEELEYSEQRASLAPSELRFDFKGQLLTPAQARSVAPDLGLHHHGDAPGAAGYTILELAHLARSSYASQRALAIQTAGRVLYRLRTGQFNKSSDLQYGLEALVVNSRLMESLYEAASEKTRNLTVRTIATEALWLANADHNSK